MHLIFIFIYILFLLVVLVLLPLLLFINSMFCIKYMQAWFQIY